MDTKLSGMLNALGDEFRPSSEYIAQWGYEVDARGATPSDPWPRAKT